MQHSDDLLVTFLQRLHHPDRMAYVGLTLGRGIYLATMSSRRKFECDGKLGSVRGHTDIFGQRQTGRSWTPGLLSSLLLLRKPLRLPEPIDGMIERSAVRSADSPLIARAPRARLSS